MTKTQTKLALAPGAEVELEISSIAFGGSGVARVEGLVCFVPGGVPGDVVRAVVRKRRRRHRECEIIGVVSPSPLRVEPRCAHFGFCGGCSFQSIRYEEQLRFKEGHVRDCLERLGGIENPPLAPAIAMDDPWFYRNKMEYTFGPFDGELVLGLMRKGYFNRVVDLRECFLQSPAAQRILGAARGLARTWGLEPYRPRSNEGVLKNLVVRIGNRGADYMVCLVTSPGDYRREAAELAALLARDFPEVKSFYHFRNPAVSGVAISGESELVSGAPHIEETILGLRFRVSPESFLQVNLRQTEVLYEKALELAAPGAGDTGLDLYCGAGPITLLLAGRAGRVLGLESVETAVRDARLNAEANGVKNAEFTAAPVEKILPEILAAEKPDFAIIDPPRAGMHPKAVKALAADPPPRLVYISCNPSTLARDVAALIESGYTLRSVLPVDMFPQTFHIETVSLLER